MYYNMIWYNIDTVIWYTIIYRTGCSTRLPSRPRRPVMISCPRYPRRLQKVELQPCTFQYRTPPDVFSGAWQYNILSRVGVGSIGSTSAWFGRRVSTLMLLRYVRRLSGACCCKSGFGVSVSISSILFRFWHSSFLSEIEAQAHPEELMANLASRILTSVLWCHRRLSYNATEGGRARKTRQAAPIYHSRSALSMIREFKRDRHVGTRVALLVKWAHKRSAGRPRTDPTAAWPDQNPTGVWKKLFVSASLCHAI